MSELGMLAGMTTNKSTSDKMNGTPTDLAKTTELGHPDDQAAAEHQRGERAEGRRKLFAVVGHLPNGRQETTFVSADSADSVGDTMIHQYGCSADDVEVYELRTV